MWQFIYIFIIFEIFFNSRLVFESSLDLAKINLITLETLIINTLFTIVKWFVLCDGLMDFTASVALNANLIVTNQGLHWLQVVTSWTGVDGDF